MGIGIENRVMGFWEMSVSRCRRLSGCLLSVVGLSRLSRFSGYQGCQVIKLFASHYPVVMFLSEQEAKVR